jgi:nucleoside-diphosphate-sugar epimerase
MQSQNYLVIGANGFIGCHVCKKLLEENQNVSAMIVKNTNLDLLKKLNPQFDHINLVYGDLTEIETLKPLVKGIDVVINVAGVIKGLEQKIFDDVNCWGSINLCKAILEVNPSIKRVILTSSLAGVGGGRNKAVTEEDEPMCLDGDRYGVSKWKFEKAIKPYMKLLPISIVRPPVVLGPGDIPSIDLFNFPKGGMKFVFGTKPLIYSIVDVEDLVNGIWAMATHPNAVGEIFYFTSGQPTEWGAIQELIGTRVFGRKYGSLLSLSFPPKLALMFGRAMEIVGKITGKPPFLTMPKLLEGINHWYCCRDKAERLLGWKPKENISSTVMKAGNWYKENGLL